MGAEMDRGDIEAYIKDRARRIRAAKQPITADTPELVRQSIELSRAQLAERYNIHI